MDDLLGNIIVEDETTIAKNEDTGLFEYSVLVSGLDEYLKAYPVLLTRDRSFTEEEQLAEASMVFAVSDVIDGGDPQDSGAISRLCSDWRALSSEDMFEFEFVCVFPEGEEPSN